MIPQHVSMVGGEHDNSVVEQVLFPQGSYHNSDLMVDVGALDVEGSIGIANGVRVETDWRVFSDSVLELFWQLISIASTLGDYRFFTRNVVLHPYVGFWRGEWRVRRRIRQVAKAGTSWVTTKDRCSHLLASPMCGVKMFWQMPRPSDVLMISHAVCVGAACVALMEKMPLVIVRN